MHIGKDNDGLYLPLSHLTQNQLQESSFTMKEALVGQARSKIDLELWHKRLVHMSTTVLNKIFSIDKQFSTNIFNQCIMCPYAKQTRSVVPVTSIKSTGSFDLVNIDLWVPIRFLLLMAINTSLQW